MRVVHLFNCHVASGPEKLALPALAQWRDEVHVLNLLEARRTQDTLSEKGAAALARNFGLRADDIMVRSRWDKAAIHELAMKLRELQPQIVHSHDVKASLYLYKASQLLPAADRPFLVSTHHGVRGRYGWKVRLYERYYTHLILPRFDRVLAVCPSDRDLLIERGLSPERTETHLNGVTRPLISQKDRAEVQARIRARWLKAGYIDSTGDFLIGLVARLDEGKNHEKAFAVIQEIVRRDPKTAIRLLCFGAGSLLSVLQTKIQDSRLERHVRLCGYDSNVSSEMAGFDLLLSLSEAEGLPVNLLEAGWSATPVLSTGVDGVLELIQDGSNGCLVSVSESIQGVADKIIALKNDPSLSNKLSLHLQETVQARFSEAAWLKRLRQIYDELLMTKQPARHSASIFNIFNIFAKWMIGALFLLQLTACATQKPSPEDLKWLQNSSAPESASSPAESAPLTTTGNTDLIQPGHTLTMSCLEDAALNGRFRVRFDGKIELPYAKVIPASGKTLGALRGEIEALYRPFFKEKVATITLRWSSRDVLIEVRGLVQKPGRYLVKPDTSLDEAVALAGGFSSGQTPPFASLTTSTGQTRTLNLNNYYRSGTPITSWQWTGGESLVLIQDVGPDVARQIAPTIRILGEVKSPGEYTYSPHSDIYHYLAMAGGPTSLADQDRVELVRGSSHERRTVTLAMKGFSDYVNIQNGDVIIIHSNQTSTLERRVQIGASVASVISTLLILLLAVF